MLVVATPSPASKYFSLPNAQPAVSCGVGALLGGILTRASETTDSCKTKLIYN